MIESVTMNIGVLAAGGNEEFGWQIFRVLITSAVSGVIVALVTQAAVRATLKNVKEKQADHDKHLSALAKQIASLQRERSDCELRAARTYAGREEMAQVFEKIDGIGNRMGERMESLRDGVQTDIQAVHTRVTEVATRLARFQGEVED